MVTSHPRDSSYGHKYKRNKLTKSKEIGGKRWEGRVIFLELKPRKENPTGIWPRRKRVNLMASNIKMWPSVWLFPFFFVVPSYFTRLAANFSNCQSPFWVKLKLGKRFGRDGEEKKWKLRRKWHETITTFFFRNKNYSIQFRPTWKRFRPQWHGQSWQDGHQLRRQCQVIIVARQWGGGVANDRIVRKRCSRDGRWSSARCRVSRQGQRSRQSRSQGTAQRQQFLARQTSTVDRYWNHSGPLTCSWVAGQITSHPVAISRRSPVVFSWRSTADRRRRIRASFVDRFVGIARIGLRCFFGPVDVARVIAGGCVRFIGTMFYDYVAEHDTTPAAPRRPRRQKLWRVRWIFSCQRSCDRKCESTSVTDFKSDSTSNPVRNHESEKTNETSRKLFPYPN